MSQSSLTIFTFFNLVTRYTEFKFQVFIFKYGINCALIL